MGLALQTTKHAQEPGEWTPQEMRIVNQFNLRMDDSRGVLLKNASESSESTMDYIATSTVDALEYYMTTVVKKDIIYVATPDYADLPEDFRHTLDVHEVVKLYLIKKK